MNMSAQLAERPSTELAMLPPAERAQAILKTSDLAPKLIALAKESQHIVAITNGDGYKQAHAKRMVLKNERIALEKAGKGAREDATAFSKAVIAEEDRLIGIIKPEETRLETLQGAWDAKVEAEKEAERQRAQKIVDDAREVVQWFRNQPAEAVGKPATEIADMLRVVEQAPLTELPEQFVREGEAAKLLAIAKLGELYAARKGFELEQMELLAAQADLDRKAKQAEDERAELLAINQVVASCVGASAAAIHQIALDLAGDPPINPTQAVLDAYESAKSKILTLHAQAVEREEAAQRDADARADRDRVDAIKRRIDDIRHLAREAVGKSTEAISVLLTELEATPADFAEFNADAVCAQEETRTELRRLHGEADAREKADADFRAQAAADANKKAQEAADKRAADEKAERDRADLERAETQRRIAECTLLEAAVEALAFLDQDYNNTLAQQMLRSAIERAA